jgi:hypothetical protein
MRKLTAIAVALGFLATTSLPTIAAPAINTGVVKTDTLSAAAKKKTTKKSMKKSTKKTKKSMKKSAKKPMKKPAKKSTKKTKKPAKKMPSIN